MTLDDHPIITDDKTYEKMFEGKEKVYFMDRGEKIGVLADRGKKRRNPGRDILVKLYNLVFN